MSTAYHGASLTPGQFQPQLPPSASGMVEVGLPNQTVYLQNLDERVKPKDLEPKLFELFSKFGEVKRVIVKHRLALRGQAFVIFNDLESSKKALSEMQGYLLYGKSMVVRYARMKSDVISRADGTFEDEYRRRLHDRAERLRNPRSTRRQMMQQVMNNPSMQHLTGGLPALGPDMALPNKILFLQNLPAATTEPALTEIFRKFQGFCEVRLVPNRHDVAFVEYENEQQANGARVALDKYIIQPGHEIRVTFARR